MADFRNDNVTTESDDRAREIDTRRRGSRGPRTVEYLIYWLLGLLEVLLVSRLVLRLFGANPNNDLVRRVYNLSDVFVWPFRGIFPAAATNGTYTTSVLEPATIIAIVVYAFLAWVVARLLGIFADGR